jgi:hypothetical protein
MVICISWLLFSNAHPTPHLPLAITWSNDAVGRSHYLCDVRPIYGSAISEPATLFDVVLWLERLGVSERHSTCPSQHLKIGRTWLQDLLKYVNGDNKNETKIETTAPYFTVLYPTKKERAVDTFFTVEYFLPFKVQVGAPSA